MSNRHERYVEDTARWYPNLTRSELIRSERVELVVTALWFYASPDWAKGAGFAYLGFMVAEVSESLGRIKAFKYLMPED